MNRMRTTFYSVLAAALLLLVHEVHAQSAPDYSIGPQDVLNITVFGETELSGRFTVEQDGTFTYPQLGRIKAGGVTLRALEAELKKQLADGYLRNPQVAVAIETYRSQRILIMGEVRNPGEYQLAGEMTLLAALARAGSTLPTASSDVLIVRAPRRGSATGTAPDTIHVDLNRLQAGNLADNLVLQDGDTVNVQKAQLVFVTGQVKSPGAFAAERGATVLQVLSLAGGLTDRGSSGRITIQRTAKDPKTRQDKIAEVKAKLTDVVQPGDTIIVGERFF